MEIRVRKGDLLSEASSLAVLGAFEDVPLPQTVAVLLEPEDFRGKSGETLVLYPRGALAPRRLLLVGLGSCGKATAETIRRVSGTAAREAQRLQASDVTVAVHGEPELAAEQIGQAFAEGLVLGSYRFWRYQTGLSAEQTFEVRTATVFSNADAAVRGGVEVGLVTAAGVAFARDLVNGPGYAMTPAALAGEAVRLGERTGLKVTVLDKAQLIEQGFGGILAVGKGSANDPQFIVMEYGQAQAGVPTICLVGKGLTFDSGGLSLKPATAMETMKSDMGGAAAVLGAMQVIADLKLPLHVVGLVSAAENMPSSDSYRPGDIVRTLSGKTIEVLNTDAEGRIILSDALTYSQRYNPDAIIELSTLTGAIIIALGPHAIGMFGTDQQLLNRLAAAGEVTGERVWPFPMWDEYRAMVKSEIADLKNLAGAAAGSITAGAFLAAFTGDYPFVHLDIAGTAWVDRATKPYESHGGTGIGVRLLAQLLREYTK